MKGPLCIGVGRVGGCKDLVRGSEVRPVGWVGGSKTLRVLNDNRGHTLALNYCLLHKQGFNGICTCPSPPQQALNIMEQRHSGPARVPAPSLPAPPPPYPPDPSHPMATLLALGLLLATK